MRRILIVVAIVAVIAAGAIAFVVLSDGDGGRLALPGTSNLPAPDQKKLLDPPANGLIPELPAVEVPTVAAPAEPSILPKEPLGLVVEYSRTSAEQFAALKAKAGTGTLDLMITLDVDATPEGETNPATQKAQRDRIKSVREGLLADLEGTGIEVLGQWDEAPRLGLRVPAPAFDILEASSAVLTVDEDTGFVLAGTSPNDPKNSCTTSVSSPNASGQTCQRWWDWYRANADDIWATGYDGNGVTVGILDTGSSRTHPWLTGKLVREACYQTINGCPNGSTQMTGTGAAAPCTYDAVRCDHGTHVAGIAAGTQGLARRANIIAIQVFQRVNTAQGPRPTAQWVNIEWGLWDVYQQRNARKIAAVNLSLGDQTQHNGFCDSASAFSGIKYWAQVLRNVGIATVVASDNQNFNNGVAAPACLSNVVSVGNTTQLSATGYNTGADAVYGGAGTPGSNSGWVLSLLAPGSGICNSLLAGSSACATSTGHGFKLGTSMAAPKVTGAFAALEQYEPWGNASTHYQALWDCGAWVQDSRNNLWKKRIDAYNALICAYYN